MVPPVLWRARTRSVHGPAAGHEFWLQVPECATLSECPPDKLALEVMPAPSSWKKEIFWSHLQISWGAGGNTTLLFKIRTLRDTPGGLLLPGDF